MRSPTQQCLDGLGALWEEYAQDPEARLLIWRLPEDATRMLDAFFELQGYPGDWSIEDEFLHLDMPFETGFTYSQTLKTQLRDSYLAVRNEAGPTANADMPSAFDWEGYRHLYPESATGFFAMLTSFTHHHYERWRHLVAIFQPQSCTSDRRFIAWLSEALAMPLHGRLRIVLVDTFQEPRWQPLVNRFSRITRVMEARIDINTIMAEESLMQPSAGPNTALGILMGDTLRLLHNGNAGQVSQRAHAALQLARRTGASNQQVALHMMMAGAWTKEKNYSKAVEHYRQGQVCVVDAQNDPTSVEPNLHIQLIIGEAGVLLLNGKWIDAAETYVRAAEAAKAAPDHRFVIEAYRMAGYCYRHVARWDDALDHYLLAVRASEPLTVEQRSVSTLPLALQDMLEMHDFRRVRRMKNQVGLYERRIEQLRARAEKKARRIRHHIDTARMARIETHLRADIETAFLKAVNERERIIARGDVFFRKVIALGRKFLEPTWSGLPRIACPTHRDEADWEKLVELEPLPEPDDLIDCNEFDTVQDAPRSFESDAGTVGDQCNKNNSVAVDC